MSNPWFRLYTEAVDDEKLRLLAFEDRWHFIAMLCCKGKGIIDEANKDLMRRKVAVKLGLDPRAMDEVARRLAEVGLIDEKTLQPLAWENRQFGSDSDPTRAERLRKFRENKKRMRNGHETDAKRPPEEDTDTEAETEVSQKREETAQAPLASPPTLSPATPTTATTPPPKVAKASKPAKPLKAPMPADWTPAETTYALLEKQGMDRPFAESCLDEFRLYWQERGESRTGWEASFVNSVKHSWEKRPAVPGGGRVPPTERFDAHAKHARLVAANQAAVAEWLAQEDSANPWGITVLQPPELTHATH